MAKPPAVSSILFGALADSGKIKQKKNGSYKMVLEGVDEIDWFTDSPEPAEGSFNPRKLVLLWDQYFSNSKPKAQITSKSGEDRQALAFKIISKPRTFKSEKIMFKIKSLTDSGSDKLTGLQDIELSDISLFIDDALEDSGLPSCLPNCYEADLRGLDMSGQLLVSDFGFADFSPKGVTRTNLSRAVLNDARLSDADLSGANLTGAFMPGATLIDADLTGADLSGADLTWAAMFGANLTDADLTGANLGGANLLDAVLFDANLTDADLSGVNLTDADLTGALYSRGKGKFDQRTNWPSAEWWNNTTCPDGTNSDSNPFCGF